MEDTVVVRCREVDAQLVEVPQSHSIGGATSKVLGGPHLRPTTDVLQATSHNIGTDGECDKQKSQCDVLMTFVESHQHYKLRQRAHDREIPERTIGTSQTQISLRALYINICTD